MEAEGTSELFASTKLQGIRFQLSNLTYSTHKE